MNHEESVLLLKDYGKINLRLKEKMDEQSISRNSLARSIHCRFEVIDKWYRNDVQKLDLDILSRICFIFDCHIEDLLEYQKPL